MIAYFLHCKVKNWLSYMFDSKNFTFILLIISNLELKHFDYLIEYWSLTLTYFHNQLLYLVVRYWGFLGRVVTACRRRRRNGFSCYGIYLREGNLRLRDSACNTLPRMIINFATNTILQKLILNFLCIRRIVDNFNSLLIFLLIFIFSMKIS